jgi:PIN domain nuclease of toxin-antitoxin system
VTAPLLDTHAWLWWIGRDPRLKASAAAELDALSEQERPYLSAISLWEAAMLVERRRITIAGSIVAWLDAAASPRTVQLVPITTAIAAETAALPDTFHRDPADRIIIATSRALGVPLLTYDRVVLRSRLAKRWHEA